jgi:hypothetical protein
MRHFLGRLVRFRALPYYYIPVRGICQEFFVILQDFFWNLQNAVVGVVWMAFEFLV